MDHNKIKSLKEHLANMRRELELLTAQAGDFPALVRNSARVSASLGMMEITLGMENSAMDNS